MSEEFRAAPADVVREPIAGTPGRPSKYSDGEATDLLKQTVGVSEPIGFRRLVASEQVRAISALRTRGVSYRQIARLTGLSTASVQRRQASRV